MFEPDAENSKYRILIVEDGLFNQFVLRKILEDSYTLAMAATAVEAMKKVHEFQPHLILLDIILPDANGFDILVTLKGREKTKDIPVIVITGLNSDEDEEKGFLLGAVDYIKRPFKNAIVRARVNTQIHIIHQMQMIEKMGMIDALTGISNRRAFDIQIHYEWRRAMREQSELAMMMIDIDKFKAYNDTYGHPQGDIMLQAVAEAIKSTLKRSTDLVYRYGGEEFAVLLPDTGLKGTLTVAQRLKETVERTEVLCFNPQTVTKETISIGVAAMQPQATDQLASLVEKADQMLYKAKRNGRNQVQP